jgi:heme exporter protein A
VSAGGTFSASVTASAAAARSTAGNPSATAGETPAVELRDVRRRFRATAVLRGIDLSIGRGEGVAVFGANGAGKSTVLRMLAGLLRADSGSVRLFGIELPGGGALRRRIGYLGHDAFLYRDLDARENLTYYARLFGVNEPESVDRWIADVGLERVATRRVATYSRGMLQRLGLARALLHDPELLLLDEPLTGLDPDGAALLDAILRRRIAAGTTVLMATHDLERATASSTRAIILARGRVAWDSGPGAVPPAADIAARYASTMTAPPQRADASAARAVH